MHPRDHGRRPDAPIDGAGDPALGPPDADARLADARGGGRVVSGLSGCAPTFRRTARSPPSTSRRSRRREGPPDRRSGAPACGTSPGSSWLAGIAVAGSDLKETKGVAGAARPRRPDRGRPRRGAPRRARRRRRLERDRAGQRRGPAAEAAGIPVWRRQQALAALAAGRRAVAIAGHAREDDDDVDGRARPRARRPRSDLPRGRRPERERLAARATATASCSCSRPTRATGRSCSRRRRSG